MLNYQSLNLEHGWSEHGSVQLLSMNFNPDAWATDVVSLVGRQAMVDMNR